MKRFLSILLMLAALPLGAADPRVGGVGVLSRDDFTAYSNEVRNTRGLTWDSVYYLSPVGGENYVWDATNKAPLFEGQIGISYSADRNGTIWFAGQTNGLGTNSWGYPLRIPGSVLSFGDQWYSPAHGANREWMNIYFNGGPNQATLSNIFVNHAGGATADSYLAVHNVNPFSSGSSIGTIRYSTNDLGPGNRFLIGTNGNGVRIYMEVYAGLHFVTIPDGYPIGETNQAPCNVIIPGTGYPFYISYNGGIPGEEGLGSTGQRAALAIDSRYLTNSAFPFDLLIPKQVTNCWSITNVNWRNTARFNTINGNVEMTNGTAMFSNILAVGRANGSYIYGNAYSPNAAMFQVNGSAAFNGNSGLGDYDIGWTFDAAEGQRFGIISQNGNYVKVTHATNAPMQFAISQQTSLGAANTTANALRTQMALSNETFTVNVHLHTTLSNSVAPGAVSVSTSPFLWTNVTLGNLFVNVSGGAVQGIGMNGAFWSRAITNGSVLIPLQPGQWIGITNTTAPLMVSRAW